jgi:2-amino-4-hydroxy-6-hydroxymethyldihydropteridine diphosphokinase
MPLCVLGLGSNRPLGEKPSEALLSSAAAELSGVLGDFRVSPVYRSAPLHVTDQSPFLNAAVSGFFPAARGAKTSRREAGFREEARSLLDIVMAIESRHGRDRASERRWGERSLDIDILLFGDEIVGEPELIIPHPRLRERAFALRPLLDLLPDAVEPGTLRPYRDILRALPPQDIGLEGYLLPEGDTVYSSYRWKALP